MILGEALKARIVPLMDESATTYDPCHDHYHVGRVARLAHAIALAEGADADVVVAAAWLHDLDRVGATDRLAATREHLSALGVSADLTARIVEAVDRHKDKSFTREGVRPRSLEAAVLSDADKLEAIGAIGIGRAFSFGGFKQRAMWDGAPTEVPNHYESGAHGTTIQHFYDKLLRLEADFATATGRAMAKQRTQTMRDFLDAFFAEWHGRT